MVKGISLNSARIHTPFLCVYLDGLPDIFESHFLHLFKEDNQSAGFTGLLSGSNVVCGVLSTSPGLCGRYSAAGDKWTVYSYR